MIEINRDNVGDLKLINYEIHDKWFSVDHIQYDPTLKVFKLEIFNNKNLTEGSMLVISSVEEYEVQDSERVGIYDIYEITIDVPRNQISLIGNIPIDIKLRVKNNFKVIYQ